MQKISRAVDRIDDPLETLGTQDLFVGIVFLSQDSVIRKRGAEKVDNGVLSLFIDGRDEVMCSFFTDVLILNTTLLALDDARRFMRSLDGGIAFGLKS